MARLEVKASSQRINRSWVAHDVMMQRVDGIDDDAGILYGSEMSFSRAMRLGERWDSSSPPSMRISLSACSPPTLNEMV